MKTDIENKAARCGRCGSGEIDGPRWENGWPNYGTIDLGYAAQAFGALCGMKYCAAPEHFAVWKEGHPAMTDNGAQHVRFEWNTGKNDFRLCRSCQTDLFKVVGEFFGFPRRAKELSSANDTALAPPPQATAGAGAAARAETRAAQAQWLHANTTPRFE